jgi:hypothetical protein
VPAKPKRALASLRAAHQTLDKAFGAERKLALLVAADCGAAVASTFERFCAIEPFLLALETREGIERAMVTTAASEKDDTGRRLKIKHPVIIHGGRIFSTPNVPHPELRQALAAVAPSFGVFADVLDHLQRLHDVGAQLRAFYAAHPERRDLLRQLTNDKKLMTLYVQRAVPTLGIARRLSTSELAALAIVVGVEEPSADTGKLADNWRKVRKSVGEVESALAKLPTFTFLW